MKLGIVVPWFGRDLKGGAEQHAWQIASRLAARRHSVEVLTTCCRAHQDDWSTNHLPEGSSKEPEGFTIRRFPVDQRDQSRFHQVWSRLQAFATESLIPGVSPIIEEDAQVFVDELIRSEALQRFLEHHRTDFDAFILLPYLYGPVIHGVAAVADRACLQPCLHDEAYAYLPQVAGAFYNAKRLLFISDGEAELAAHLYGPAVAAKSVIVGAGVEVPTQAPAKTVGESSANGRFILYLGRKEPGKNTDMLVRAFARFRRVRPNSQLRLILAGYGRLELNGAAGWIIDRGLVSDAEKARLLRECLALAQPSVNESFSRTMMEAWRYGKPVAANRACRATALEVTRCAGGWLPSSEDEWAAWFVEVDRVRPEDLDLMGNNGRRHADIRSDWDAVIDRYERALEEMIQHRPDVTESGKIHPASINQFLPNLSPGDAISNEAIFIRDKLREAGFKSEIYVDSIHPRLPPNECNDISTPALEASDAIIYHHSIGTWITPHVANCARPKCLIYHNITPAEFFEAYRPKFAELLREGRRDLPDLAPAFKLSYGDSTYNAKELAAGGFTAPEVLPICVDPQKWSFPPDPDLMRSLSDGRTNILFVGRVAPNKKQDELVQAFARYRIMDPGARLLLVGVVEHEDPYANHLFHEIRRLGLDSSVHVADSVSDAQLAAYYRTAHLFWSMSEHEGFLVPVVEAMWFDIPVLAYHSTAVPETLGEAAFTFKDKSDPDALAAAAYLLVTNPTLRQQVITAQRRQRDCYLPSRVTPLLMRLVDRLLNSEGPFVPAAARKAAASARGRS
jgi:glycosyltransferase involved in cell wall biosynthesis